MLTLMLAAIVAAPNPARNVPPSLIGQTVLLRQTSITATYGGADGRANSLTLNLTDAIVLHEEPGRVGLRNLGREVWVARDNVLTAKEAIAVFTDQISTTPQNPLPYVRRAKAYELLNDPDAGLKDYDELIRLAPTASAYWNNRANLWAKKKDLDKAVADYEKAIELAPQSFIPLSNLGNVHGTRRDWAKALEFYDRALQLNPVYARGYAARSGTYRETKDFKKALADAEQALKLDLYSPHGYASRGLVRAALKSYEPALADYNEAIALDPSFAAAYLYRGNLYLARQQYQPAIRDFDRAAFLSPGNAAALAGRASGWSACGNHRLALTDADAAIQADAKYAAGHRVRAWLLATCPVDAHRNGNEAVASAKASLELSKDGGASYFEAMAAALAEIGDFPGAVTWQKKAFADADYVKDKGPKVQQRLGMYEARQAYRE